MDRWHDGKTAIPKRRNVERAFVSQILMVHHKLFVLHHSDILSLKQSQVSQAVWAVYLLCLSNCDVKRKVKTYQWYQHCITLVYSSQTLIHDSDHCLNFELIFLYAVHKPFTQQRIDAQLKRSAILFVTFLCVSFTSSHLLVSQPAVPLWKQLRAHTNSYSQVGLKPLSHYTLEQ